VVTADIVAQGAAGPPRRAVGRDRRCRPGRLI